MPTAPGAIALAPVSLALGVTVGFLGWVLVNLLALSVIEIRGYVNLNTIVMNLFCGLIVPVSWFPEWLRSFAAITPFPSMFQAPIDLAMGRGDAVTVLGVQAFWVLLLGAAAQMALTRGLRTVVIQGG
jgi:ABC-2 type transport system permease protein